MSNVGAAVSRLLHRVLGRDQVSFVIREASLRSLELKRELGPKIQWIQS